MSFDLSSQSLPPSLQRLVEGFSQLPGIGRKTAERLAFHLIQTDRALVDRLIQGLTEVKERVLLCSRCQNLTEVDPCTICNDEQRDQSTLCVVESPASVWAMENMGQYRGCYYVLHGVVSPLEGQETQHLKVEPLLRTVRSGKVREIILALNHNVEGDATAHFLLDLLRSTGVNTTRLASGLPMGGMLVHADHATLSNALSGRAKLL